MQIQRALRWQLPVGEHACGPPLCAFSHTAHDAVPVDADVEGEGAGHQPVQLSPGRPLRGLGGGLRLPATLLLLRRPLLGARLPSLVLPAALGLRAHRVEAGEGVAEGDPILVGVALEPPGGLQPLAGGRVDGDASRRLGLAARPGLLPPGDGRFLLLLGHLGALQRREGAVQLLRSLLLPRALLFVLARRGARSGSFPPSHEGTL